MVSGIYISRNRFPDRLDDPLIIREVQEMSPEEVIVPCKTSNCGTFVISEREARHTESFKCIMCGLETRNPHFVNSISKSSATKENMGKLGLRKTDSPIHKELLGVVFKLKARNWTKTRIAQEMGFKSIHYLSLLLGNFERYWPKTKEAQDRILNKINKGKELAGIPILNKDSDSGSGI